MNTIILILHYLLASGSDAFSRIFASGDTVAILWVGTGAIFAFFEFVRRWGKWPTKFERQIDDIHKAKKQIMPDGPALSDTPFGRSMEQIKEICYTIKKMEERLDHIEEAQKGLASNQMKLTRILHHTMRNKNSFASFD